MIKYEKESSISYALGTTLTFELLNNRPALASRIYISPKQKRDETYEKLVGKARALHLPVIENNERIFKDLSGKDNTMVIAEFKKQSSPLDPNANHIVLVNPSNMGNLGTIIRSSVGFGITNLAIITPAADIFDPKAVRATMGALFHMNFELFPSYEAYIAKVGQRYSYPFMLQAKKALKDCNPIAPWSIVFGNEATGLNESFLSIGEPLLIPHTPFVDSLNLDNAAAIGIYEFTKNAF